MVMNAPDLSPILQRQNAVENDYAAKLAANTFSRGLSQQRGSRNVMDFRQGFQRSLPKFTANFGRRGLAGGGIQSGVFGQAMQDYVGDYTKNLGRMTEDNFNQDQQFGFDAARFAAERDNALADLATQKAQLIASTAQSIAGLRPYMGG